MRLEERERESERARREQRTDTHLSLSYLIIPVFVHYSTKLFGLNELLVSYRFYL